MPQVAAGMPAALHSNLLRQARSNVEANHAIMNEMPPIPTTAATCIKGRLPYCV